MIVKAGEYLNRNALLTLYYSFVYPYLTYCNHVWGCTYQANLKQLFILQKKVLRIMFVLKILKFIDINLYLTGRFMQRFFRGDVPGIFNELFHCNNYVHNYFTRQSEYLPVPLEKSNLSQFCIRYRVVTVWNAILKSNINSNCSEYVFSKSLKSSFIASTFSL